MDRLRDDGDRGMRQRIACLSFGNGCAYALHTAYGAAAAMA